ncbi:hypothetical protein OH146_11250 [Salinibacterium sp. SYSU T00001]|uniref:hypothetical protein n=1 Tax=Homoserinimonas sedimenticola TaxID=2986805 RepID=UPI002235931E|nr:hypothetical protein [Salinibacterium sedimenticola]MCW4386349.1 hypothetical protein [Salinibacterium sedimenticola]
MAGVAAVLILVILAALAVFQLALIAGAPLGRFAWGGQYRVLPTKLRVGSVVSIVLYVLFAGVVLDKVGVIDVFADAVADVAMWVLFAYFTLGILMNAISRSKPERYVMTPVCVVLAAASLVIALS